VPENYYSLLFVMAGVTYLVRMLPLAVLKRRLENRFVRSLLLYIPYAVLGAMTFPAILYSTQYMAAAAAGLVVAVVLALLEKDLLVVALSACGAVVIAEAALRYFGRMG